VDVVMSVLLLKLANVGSGSLNVTSDTGVLVLSPHLVKLSLMLRVHLLLVLLDLYRGSGVDVFGGKNLVVLNWLHSVLERSVTTSGGRGSGGHT
jgi:hypothetical protein